MAKSRVELHEELCSLLGSRNVYFQPPESFKIKYPCIVYNFSSFDTKRADDLNYLLAKSYDVTFITEDPDSDFPVRFISAYKHCRHSRNYVSDGLHHDTFVLYY